MPAKRQTIAQFRGLVNKIDPLVRQAGDEAGMSVADNVDVSQAGKLTRAEGYVRRHDGPFTDLYVTEDEQRAFVVEDRILKELDASFETWWLWDGLAADQLQWTEVNGVVYATNGTDYLIIEHDRARPWGLPVPLPPRLEVTEGALPAGVYQVTATYLEEGRESGAPLATTIKVPEGGGIRAHLDPRYQVRLYISAPDADVLYRALETTTPTVDFQGPIDDLVDPIRTQFLAPPPGGHAVAHWRGRIYLAQYFPEADMTAVWPSQPLGYEWFDRFGDGLILPGEVRFMAAAREALILVGRSRIQAFDGEQIQDLAPYGAPHGDLTAYYQGQAYFWTDRGLCRALPFENLTEGHVSLAPGRQGTGAIVERQGEVRYIALMAPGGEPRNAF